VGFFLRHGIKLKELNECLKRAYVENALTELQEGGHKTTTSRIAIITGVHRKDIERILKNTSPQPTRGELLTKVIGMWQSDSRFSTKDHRPRLLRGERGTEDFYELVRAVARELNPATVLFELERQGIVERTDFGIKLLRTAYSPPADLEHVAGLLGKDYDDITSAVSENLAAADIVPNLHARTEFDKVRPTDLPELRRWLIQEGHALHERVRTKLAALDQDTNPDPKFTGKMVKVMLGTFSRIVK
jgi:hypothetical protein